MGAFEEAEDEVNRELQTRFSPSSPSTASRLLFGKIESLVVVVVEASTRIPRREEEEEEEEEEAENKSGTSASARRRPPRDDDDIVIGVKNSFKLENSEDFLDKFSP